MEGILKIGTNANTDTDCVDLKNSASFMWTMSDSNRYASVQGRSVSHYTTQPKLNLLADNASYFFSQADTLPTMHYRTPIM